jgi:hypothetical protein
MKKINDIKINDHGVNFIFFNSLKELASSWIKEINDDIEKCKDLEICDIEWENEYQNLDIIQGRTSHYYNDEEEKKNARYETPVFSEQSVFNFFNGSIGNTDINDFMKYFRNLKNKTKKGLKERMDEITTARRAIEKRRNEIIYKYEPILKNVHIDEYEGNKFEDFLNILVNFIKINMLEEK